LAGIIDLLEEMQRGKRFGSRISSPTPALTLTPSPVMFFYFFEKFAKKDGCTLGREV
jgi:hypothetical protein